MTLNTESKGEKVVAGTVYPDDAHLSTFTQNVATFASIIKIANAEISKDEPDSVRLTVYLADVKSLTSELLSQRERAITANGLNDPNVLALQSIMQGEAAEILEKANLRAEQIEAKLVTLKEKYDSDFAALEAGAAPTAPQDAATSIAVDNIHSQEDHASMSATTDKDYIDVRLKAMSDSLDQRLETAAAKSDGRLEVIETRMDARVEAIDAKLAAGLSSMELLLARKFAEFDSTLHKSTADTVKWVAGTVLALGVIGISLMTFLLNNVAPKAAAPAPAPIIIYAQPAPAAPPPPVPATKP